MNFFTWVLLLSLAFVWSISFYLIELALREFAPLMITLMRVGIGALLLHLVVLGMRLRMPTTAAAWATFAVMGALNNAIPFTLIAWGQSHIDSGMASILNATAPIFSCILAHWLTTDERLSAFRFSGVMVAFLGIVVLLGENRFGWRSFSLLGQLAVLCAALSYAFAAIWGRRLAAYPPEVSATGMLTCSTLLLIPVVVLQSGAHQLPQMALSAVPLGACVVLGVFSTAVAYLLYFRILNRAGATNLMLVTFLIPPLAVWIGFLFLDEVLSWDSMLGMALILGGLALISKKS